MSIHNNHTIKASPLALGQSDLAAPGDGRTPTKPRCLLLGLGNDLLCDDALGLRVAAAIRDRLRGNEHISVAETPEMGLSLLDVIVGFEELVLVDAVQTGRAPPGSVHELEPDDLQTLPIVSPHFLGIGELIALGRELGLAVPRHVCILAVEVVDTVTISTQMTPTIEGCLSEVIEEVWQILPDSSVAQHEFTHSPAAIPATQGH